MGAASAAAVNDGATIAVAYSGGRDSTALLHATLAAASGLGCRVVALHVHHGLSAQADAWVAHCDRQVRRWQRRDDALTLEVAHLSGRPADGDSVEAWARRARYAALRQMALAHCADAVLLAHHRRDQAETFVLQALRGAGVAGLAAMPQAVERDGITWLRPWLHRPREAIDAYVRRHRLAFIGDDSNDDPRFARNRLRLKVWPAVSLSFPDAETGLADAARWAWQANEALHELAAIDLAGCTEGPALLTVPWHALSPARRSNTLRAWLHHCLGRPAPAALVLRLLDEWPAARSARWLAPGGQVQLHRGRLSWRPAPAVGTAGEPAIPGLPSLSRPADAMAVQPPLQSSLGVCRAGRYRLTGWGGSLRIVRVREGGVPFAWLGQLDLKAREGGEQFQAGLGRPPRSLKKQYQAAGVPAWQRGGPLVYSGGQLVYVPGLGIDARVIALPGQAQATLEWVPNDAGSMV